MMVYSDYVNPNTYQQGDTQNYSNITFTSVRMESENSLTPYQSNGLFDPMEGITKIDSKTLLNSNPMPNTPQTPLHPIIQTKSPKIVRVSDGSPSSKFKTTLSFGTEHNDFEINDKSSTSMGSFQTQTMSSTWTTQNGLWAIPTTNQNQTESYTLPNSSSNQSYQTTLPPGLTSTMGTNIPAIKF